MQKLIVLTLLIFLMTENSYAVSTSVSPLSGESVVLIEKGLPAPFKGYLFPEDKAQEIRKELIELDSLRAMESSYQKSIDIYKKNQDLYDYKTNVLLDQNEKLAKAVSSNKYDGYIGFAVGILVTGLSIWGAKEVLK